MVEGFVTESRVSRAIIVAGARRHGFGGAARSRAILLRAENLRLDRKTSIEEVLIPGIMQGSECRREGGFPKASIVTDRLVDPRDKTP